MRMIQPVILAIRILAAVLFISMPSWAKITYVQSIVSNSGCSQSTTTNCQVTLSTATTVGNVGIMCAEVLSGAITAPTQGGTWTLAYAWSGGGSKNISCYYTTFTSSVSSITATIGTPKDARNAWYWEYSSSIAGVAWSLDSGTFTLDGSCTNCAGQPLTLAGTNDTVVQVYSANNAPTGITAYANFTTSMNRGGADLINTTSDAAPAWTNPSTANVVVGAVAISEGAVAAAAPPPPVYTCYPGNESGCPTLCPNTASLTALASTSPAIDCVRGVSYSNLSAPTQALTFDLYTPHDVDPHVPAIVFWCGGAYSGCIDNGSGNLCIGGTTAGCVLMAEATGRPVYVVNITQGSRCWLSKSVSSGTSMVVNCIQVPATGTFSFWLDYQTPSAEHLTCSNCGNGGGVTWTLSTPITKSHYGASVPAEAALVLPDAVAPPRAEQDADCFGRWFGNNGGTSAYPGNPLDMRLWSFSSGSTMAAMLMPSAAGAFSPSCDSSGIYKIGPSFITALPADLAETYKNSANAQYPIEEYLGCRPTSGSACETYSKAFSPIQYVGLGNPQIGMMSGAVGDDITVPPMYNEIPLVSAYGAIGVTIPWLPLAGQPDYHCMDCGSTPLWTTNCLQQAIKFFVEAIPN